MICLRCGYCCIAYDVIIISPEFVQPKINFDNPEISHKLIHKKCGEICPHLRWEENKAVCSIHHYEWYKDTPCFRHEQIESSPKSLCRLGEYFQKEGICIKTKYDKLQKINHLRCGETHG